VVPRRLSTTAGSSKETIRISAEANSVLLLGGGGRVKASGGGQCIEEKLVKAGPQLAAFLSFNSRKLAEHGFHYLLGKIWALKRAGGSDRDLRSHCEKWHRTFHSKRDMQELRSGKREKKEPFQTCS